MEVKIKDKVFGLRYNMNALNEIEGKLGKCLHLWVKECGETISFRAKEVCYVISTGAKWAGSDVSVDWLMENLEAEDLDDVLMLIVHTINRKAREGKLEANPL